MGNNVDREDIDNIQQFVIPDAHLVYYDAVRNSPWNQSEEGGNLPGKDDWSTFRYAVKDIILGVVTHRYNRQTRRLEVRAYFVGEHPLFREFEPTRALVIVLCSQAYQSGGSMEIYFEHGIPFDIRCLIEKHLSIQISGHEKLLPAEISKQLYAALSNFPAEIRAAIADEVPLELVCFNTFRGTWSANHIRSLIQQGISLQWLFQKRPDPLRIPLTSLHLFNHLRASMMEEYAIARLANRQLGVSAGKRINRVDESCRYYFVSDFPLRIPDSEASTSFETDSFVDLPPQQPFAFVVILTHSDKALVDRLPDDLARAKSWAPDIQPILVVPLDFAYLGEDLRKAYCSQVRASKVFLLVIGLTISQLLAETQYNLSVTAAQVETDEVEDVNVARYAD